MAAVRVSLALMARTHSESRTVSGVVSSTNADAFLKSTSRSRSGLEVSTAVLPVRRNSSVFSCEVFRLSNVRPMRYSRRAKPFTVRSGFAPPVSFSWTKSRSSAMSISLSNLPPCGVPFGFLLRFDTSIAISTIVVMSRPCVPEIRKSPRHRSIRCRGQGPRSSVGLVRPYGGFSTGAHGSAPDLAGQSRGGADGGRPRRMPHGPAAMRPDRGVSPCVPARRTMPRRPSPRSAMPTAGSPTGRRRR